MKRLLPVFIAVLFWSGAAHAQEFGFRGGLQLLTIPSVQFGTELSFGDWGLGTRASFGTVFFLISRVQVDAYVFMQISESWQSYVGMGVAGFSVFMNNSLVDVHALIGVRLNQGFYAEVVPRLFFGSSCVDTFNCTSTTGSIRALAYGIDFGLGFSWRL
jgi:hypothetical protein